MTATPAAQNGQAQNGQDRPRVSRFGVEAGHESYKWWALSCTSLGMLLAATNSGTLIIALPDLEQIGRAHV